MKKIFIVLLGLLLNAPLGARHRDTFATLTISGPLAATAGHPVSLRLKFANISTDKRMTIVKNCQSTNPVWDIRDRAGNKLLYSPIVETDCNKSPVDLGPSMWQEWSVDPSFSFRFPKTGTYFFTAMFTYQLENPQTKVATSQTVVSNTIAVNIR